MEDCNKINREEFRLIKVSDPKFIDAIDFIKEIEGLEVYDFVIPEGYKLDKTEGKMYLSLDNEVQESFPQGKLVEDKENAKCANCGSKMYSNFTGEWHDSEKCRGGKRAFNKSQEA